MVRANNSPSGMSEVPSEKYQLLFDFILEFDQHDAALRKEEEVHSRAEKALLAAGGAIYMAAMVRTHSWESSEEGNRGIPSNAVSKKRAHMVLEG